MVTPFGWTYEQVLGKARRDLERLTPTTTATMDDVFNFVLTAGHVWDWVHHDGRPGTLAAWSDMADAIRVNPAHPVNVIYEVCIGLKHVIPNRPTPPTDTQTIHTGALGGGAALKGNPPFTSGGGPVDV